MIFARRLFASSARAFATPKLLFQLRRIPPCATCRPRTRRPGKVTSWQRSAQHGGVTLHSRHEDANQLHRRSCPPRPAHRVACPLNQLAAVVGLVHRIHIGRGETPHVCRSSKNRHTVVHPVDCCTIKTTALCARWRWLVKPAPVVVACTPKWQCAKGGACALRAPRSHRRQRVAAFHPAGPTDVPDSAFVAEIQVVHRASGVWPARPAPRTRTSPIPTFFLYVDCPPCGP